MKAPNIVFGALLALGATAACNKQADPKPEPAAPAQATAGSEAVPEAKPDKPTAAPAPGSTDLGIEWSDPPAWKRVQPKTSMRKASYEIPAAQGDSEAGELSVFYFGPQQGGTVEQNIERWVGQFQDVPKDKVQRSERAVNDLTQHIVEVESGTYSAMVMGPHAPKTPPKEEQGLLGAVIEAPTGLYFFKLSGPAKTVKGARESFFKLLDSTKAKSQ